MKTQTIHIRNMCCQRCIEAVTDELQSLGLKISAVKLGSANYISSPKITVKNIETALSKRGFQVVKDEEEILFEEIKTTVLHVVHHILSSQKSKFNFHKYLENKLNFPYRNLARVFTKHSNITLEKYFILLKIEKAKDLIENSTMRFSEIAWALHYNTLQHLSAQFKNETGLTMHDYKKSKTKKRTPIEKI